MPYVRSATYRAAHQFCVRALQRQRDRDEIHTDVDTVEVDDSSTAQSCTVGLDYEKLLDGLRATALNGGDVDRGARKEHVAARDAVEFAQARAAGLEARLSQSAAALGEAKRILAGEWGAWKMEYPNTLPSDEEHARKQFKPGRRNRMLKELRECGWDSDVPQVETIEGMVCPECLAEYRKLREAADRQRQEEQRKKEAKERDRQRRVDENRSTRTGLPASTITTGGRPPRRMSTSRRTPPNSVRCLLMAGRTKSFSGGALYRASAEVIPSS